MKFRDLTKGAKGSNTYIKPVPKNRGAINLLTGKPVKRNKKPKIKKTEIISFIPSITYNITNLDLKHLPVDAQRLLNNTEIIQTNITGSSYIYKLINGFVLKVTNKRIGKYNKHHIIFTHKRKILIDTIV